MPRNKNIRDSFVKRSTCPYTCRKKLSMKVPDFHCHVYVDIPQGFPEEYAPVERDPLHVHPIRVQHPDRT